MKHLFKAQGITVSVAAVSRLGVGVETGVVPPAGLEGLSGPVFSGLSAEFAGLSAPSMVQAERSVKATKERNSSFFIVVRFRSNIGHNLASKDNAM